MGKNKEKKNKRTFLNVQLKRFLSLHLSANDVLNMSTGLSVSLLFCFFVFLNWTYFLKLFCHVFRLQRPLVELKPGELKVHLKLL